MEQMTLFDREQPQPLAARLRPQSLEEYAGQTHLLGKGKVLRRLIESDQVSSMIFWGPPGVGKTTLARIIAGRTKSAFIDFSAVTSGIKEIRTVMEQAEQNRRFGERTIVFVDEIHRFNKAQQDAFLPFVEKGSIILIGATTENPSFEINSALLSRCKVFVLHALTEDELTTLLSRALTDCRGFGMQQVCISDEMLHAIANFANGDARTALSTLEMVVLNGELDENGAVTVTEETLEQCTAKKSLLYDKKGEEHYNLISALHKSMRNSDPQALSIAVAAYQACHFIGMPECSVHLTQAVVYMSLAPKSNALYMAYEHAKLDAAEQLAEPVPLVIRNAVTELMGALDYGKGYQYAHDTEEKIAHMQCLPDSLLDRQYYQPTTQGQEAAYKKRLEQIKDWRAQARTPGKGD